MGRRSLPFAGSRPRVKELHENYGREDRRIEVAKHLQMQTGAGNRARERAGRIAPPVFQEDVVGADQRN